eukprot:SAG31_NODE_797_length_12029_cov_13.875692_13_plen_34_part_01
MVIVAEGILLFIIIICILLFIVIYCNGDSFPEGT